MKKYTLIVFILTLSAVIVNANTYYVAKNGSDSNNGSKELPFYTVRKAINTLTNGDSLYIREGIYREYLEVSFDSEKRWRNL